MIKRYIAITVFSTFMLQLLAMEQQESSAPIDILPNEIKYHMLSFGEPQDVAAFALTKKEHAEIVALALENPIFIGNLIQKCAFPYYIKKCRKTLYPSPLLEESVLAFAVYCGKKAASRWFQEYLKNNSQALTLAKECFDTDPWHGTTKTIGFLLESGIDANIPLDAHNFTTLHRGAHLLSKELIQLLLAKGANVNTKENSEGFTPLILACRNLKCPERHDTVKEIMRLLIEAGADINAQNNKEETALSLAKQYDAAEIIELLKQQNSLANSPEVEEKENSAQN
jgi:hypothetical protein